MKIVQKFEADDGVLFDNEHECDLYESRLPFVRLFAEVEAAVAQDAAFAGKIEALGTRIARERRASGDLKRTRAPKADPEGGTSGFSTRNEGAAA